MAYHLDVMTGSSERTDVIPRVERTIGRSYVVYVGITTVGIGDTVNWSVTLNTVWRTGYRNIVIMVP